MFWLWLITFFILLSVAAYFISRTTKLNNFIRKLKDSVEGAAKGMSFRPLEAIGEERDELILRLNEIYSSLKKSQPLTKENAALKKEREKLHEALIVSKNAVDYLQVISELGQKISSTLSLQEVIENLSRIISSIMDAAVVEIGIFDNHLEQLDFRIHNLLNATTSNENKEIYSREFANWCILNGKNIFLEDIQKNYTRYIYKFPFDRNEKIPHSLICCPMITANKITGTIGVLNFDKKPFSSYQFDMIKSLLPYAALAIENAKGHEELVRVQHQLIQQEKMASLAQIESINNQTKREKAELNQQVSITEMKALRSQMNPHFIFNSLQSIHTFLIQNNTEDASTYLLKFSKLMRIVLENSQHQEVPLKEDLEALELYMQLESLRLKYPFTYEVKMDESIDEESTSIPPLILQPFVENAIWHGLHFKEEPGHINIFIRKINNDLICTVEDNGIGRDLSKKVKQPMLMKKESLGMKLTEERLKILSELKKVKANFNITDLFNSNNKPSGTRIDVSLPTEE
jgi:hypothetical protein